MSTLPIGMSVPFQGTLSKAIYNTHTVSPLLIQSIKDRNLTRFIGNFHIAMLKVVGVLARVLVEEWCEDV